MRSKTLKRILAALASAAVTATMIAVPVSAEGTDVEISTAAELAAFRDAVNSGTNYRDVTVKLTADIDLSEYSNWTPICDTDKHPFRGTFDGQNHTISNLTINNTTTAYGGNGLFGFMNGNELNPVTGKGYIPIAGSIKNLTVSGSVYDTVSSNVGGIIGRYYGASTSELSNLTNYCTVTAEKAVVAGGVAGYISGGNANGSKTVIKNLTNYGKITNSYEYSSGYTGGVVGHLFWSSDGLANYGEVDAMTNCVGGVAGKASSAQTNITNAGTVTAAGKAVWVGGVIGGYDGKEVTNATNTGDISSSTATVAGVIASTSTAVITNAVNSGNVTATGTRGAGGVIGSAYQTTVTQCVNTGDVTGSGSCVGGVIGNANGFSDNTQFTATDIYNTGNVTGTGETTYTGGVCGTLNEATVSNSYSSGTISGPTGYTGGFVGQLSKDKEVTVSNSYYLNSNAAYGSNNYDADASDITAVTAEQLASGEIVYKLAAESDVWGQNLGKDGSPIFTTLPSGETDPDSVIYTATYYKPVNLDGKYVETLNAADGTEYKVYSYTKNGETMYYTRKTDGNKVICYYDTAYTEAQYNYLKEDVSSNYSPLYETTTVKEYNYINGTTVEKLDAVSYANEGGTFTAPAAPAEEGLNFKYWGTEENGTAYDFSNSVSSDVTLYPLGIWSTLDNVNNTGKKYRPGTGIYAEEKATGYITDITSTAGEQTVSKITWTVTSDNVTKKASIDGLNLTLAGGAEVNVALIVNGLNDAEAVVTAIAE